MQKACLASIAFLRPRLAMSGPLVVTAKQSVLLHSAAGGVRLIWVMF